MCNIIVFHFFSCLGLFLVFFVRNERVIEVVDLEVFSFCVGKLSILELISRKNNKNDLVVILMTKIVFLAEKWQFSLKVVAKIIWLMGKSIIFHTVKKFREINSKHTAAFFVEDFLFRVAFEVVLFSFFLFLSLIGFS